MRSSSAESRLSATQSGDSRGRRDACRVSFDSHGDASAGQRATSSVRRRCRPAHSADKRNPVLASTSKRSRPALHKRASRSAKVGGIEPSSVHVFNFFWHSCGACRSEEHTSELQSQSNLVCRLLLEKKKKKKKTKQQKKKKNNIDNNTN